MRVGRCLTPTRGRVPLSLEVMATVGVMGQGGGGELWGHGKCNLRLRLLQAVGSPTELGNQGGRVREGREGGQELSWGRGPR